MADNILGNGIVMLPIDEYKSLVEAGQVLAGTFSAEKNFEGNIVVRFNPDTFYEHFVNAAKAAFGAELNEDYDLKPIGSLYDRGGVVIATVKRSYGGLALTDE